jgi:hypothetical protein
LRLTITAAYILPSLRCGKAGENKQHG